MLIAGGSKCAMRYAGREQLDEVGIPADGGDSPVVDAGCGRKRIYAFPERTGIGFSRHGGVDCRYSEEYISPPWMFREIKRGLTILWRMSRGMGRRAQVVVDYLNMATIAVLNGT